MCACMYFHLKVRGFIKQEIIGPDGREIKELVGDRFSFLSQKML